MPSRLGHGLYKKIDRLKNIFRCIYIIKTLTVFLLKIRHENNNIALASPNF